MQDLVAGRYRLRWEDEVRHTDGAVPRSGRCGGAIHEFDPAAPRPGPNFAAGRMHVRRVSEHGYAGPRDAVKDIAQFIKQTQ